MITFYDPILDSEDDDFARFAGKNPHGPTSAGGRRKCQRNVVKAS